MKNMIVLMRCGLVDDSVLALLVRKAHETQNCSARLIEGPDGPSANYINWLVNPEWYDIPIIQRRVAGRGNPIMPCPTIGLPRPATTVSVDTVMGNGDVDILVHGGTSGKHTLEVFVRRSLRHVRSKSKITVHYVGVEEAHSDTPRFLRKLEDAGEIATGTTFELAESEGARLLLNPVYKRENDLALSELKQNRLVAHLARLWKRNSCLRATAPEEFPTWNDAGPHLPASWAFWKLVYPDEPITKFWLRVLQSLEHHPNA